MSLIAALMERRGAEGDHSGAVTSTQWWVPASQTCGRQPGGDRQPDHWTFKVKKEEGWWGKAQMIHCIIASDVIMLQGHLDVAHKTCPEVWFIQKIHVFLGSFVHKKTVWAHRNLQCSPVRKLLLLKNVAVAEKSTEKLLELHLLLLFLLVVVSSYRTIEISVQCRPIHFIWEIFQSFLQFSVEQLVPGNILNIL